MKPNRTQIRRVLDCFRLASYRIDGERLYSDEEIAERLGATCEWVGARLNPKVSDGHGSTLPTAEGWDPFAHITSLAYDSRAIGGTRRKRAPKARE